MKRIFYGSLLAILLLPAAFADEGKGQSLYAPTVLSTVELANGTTISRVSSSGFVISRDEDSPFHMVNQECTGTYVVAAGESEPEAYGYCEGLDRDGDMYFLSWYNSADSNTWQLLGGTGKFDGISGGGTTSSAFTWADGKFVINWDASWTMK